MCAKRSLLAHLILLGCLVFYQLPSPALGSGQSSREIISNADNRLALNKGQEKKLIQLDKKLKLYENKIKKIEDQITRFRGSK